MRPTRLGWGCLAMAALTLLTAASTGNNLLYLLYSALAGALAVSAAGGRLNLRRVRVEAEAPDQVFRAAPFSLKAALRNDSLWAAYGLEVLWQGSSAAVDRLRAGETARVEVRGTLPHRGLNDLNDLVVESAFPLGLFRHRETTAAARLLALPRLREARGAAEFDAEARATGRPTLRKGGGEELYGIREYAPGDDARIINWKLTARAGRPLVNEYCASHDERITVSVRGGDGAEGERLIEEAASACRFHIDAGAAVRLESPEETVEYGRGLSQLDRLLQALARLGRGRAARPAGPVPAIIQGPPRDSPALRRLTMAGAALTFAGMFLIDEVNPALLAGLSPALALGWAVQERGWKLLPRWVWNALSLLVLGYVLLVDWRLSGVTVSNTHLLLYLLLNRMLTPFDRRELPQIFLVLFLAFFLISGLTIALAYFAAFLAYLALAATWLTLASGLDWSGRRRWGPGLAGALAAVAAVAAGLFTVTPRVEGLRRINPFLAAGIDKLAVQDASVTGFNNEVSLGFFGQLKKSSARVMRVAPLPAPSGERRPGELRVRGAAFDVFDGNRWSKAMDRARVPAQRRGNDLLFPAAPASRQAPVYDLSIYPMNLAVLFTIGTPRLVEGAADSAWFDHTDSIQFSGPYASGVRYKVHSSADEGLLSRLPAAEAAARGRFLQVPPDPGERVASLAREAMLQAPDAAAKVRAVEAFLRKRYDYSSYSDGRDRKLEDFLFKTRKGNCEYFATAGVVLLRHAGVPARLVTGFLASDWNEYGKFYDVRQAEAHAWLEAYLPGRGWVAADPTPPQGDLAVRAEEFGRRLRHWAASVQVQWYRRVIGYDQHVQRNTFHRLGSALSIQALQGALRGAALAAALFAAVWTLGWSALRWAGLRRAPPPGLFARAQAALARAGLKREGHWTPREFAAWVLSRRPELGPVAALAELHYLQVYRPAGLSPHERARGDSLLRELGARL